MNTNSDKYEDIAETTQLLVIPFLAGIAGILSVWGKQTGYRVTLHRTMCRHEKVYLQQTVNYIASSKGAERGSGRIFPVIYNRLTLDSDHYFKSLGYTRGWGHFHIPDSIFFELRSYLRELGHSYADSHSFEDGSNWRLRNIRAAFSKLGITDDLLRHGVRREVFISELATNAISILKDGADAAPDISKLRNIPEIGQLALERWIIPRSRTRDDYKSWTLSDLASLFFSRPASQY